MRLWPRRRDAITAAAQVVKGPAPEEQQAADATFTQGDPRKHLYRTPDSWQREAWDFFDSLGEFAQAITWKANMVSRVRLRAAQIVSGQDEPKIVDTGPANDIVAELAGGVGGQSSLMSGFTIYLDVPGECYLVGETLPSGKNTWYLRSIEELRPGQRTPDGDVIWKITEGYGRWRDLPNDSLIIRVYRPHKRFNNVATSPARAARPLLRELELLNRHIQSQYLSRLASAGIVIFPDEVTFPVRPEFADAPDPFVAEWIEIAAEAIKTPGTASAVVPIPIKVPGEYVDKIAHIDFTLQLDQTIIAKRDSVLTRLAISMDMPPEALLGTRDVNHWNAWLIDEQGVKIHVAPEVEIICDALTTGYLKPRMAALAEGDDSIDPDEWVVWYDASELILRPDRSTSALAVYDRFELSGASLRRENGFDETDKPTDDERKDQILIAITKQPVNAWQAMDELDYTTKPSTQPPPLNQPPSKSDGLQPAPTPEDQEPADRIGETPRGNEQPSKPSPKSALDPKEPLRALEAKLIDQGKLEHALKIEFDGTWRLFHPIECRDHLFSCPVTHATWNAPLRALPGASGVYSCWLNPFNQPIVGATMASGKLLNMYESTHAVRGLTKQLVNGNGHGAG